MARIVLIDNTIMAPVYLKELDRRQRETIFPPGQDRYISPIDVNALTALLVSYGSAVTGAALVTATVDADDISEATIQTTVNDVTLTADQLVEVRDAISYRIVETGNFLLSFDRGQIGKLVDNGQAKVFTDLGDALFTI